MIKTKMIEFGNGWEELRKRARELENEIDLKLVSFSKLGTNYRSVPYSNPAYNSLAHRTTHNESSMSSVSEAMSMEIEYLLADLTKVNDSMSEYSQSMGLNTHNATLLHTLQRHRDILQDYSHEFHRTRTNITAVKEREALLGSIYKDNSSFRPSSQTDIYLKEHQHLTNSERMVDEQINIALNTKENLQAQKSTLYNVTSKINFITNKFPVLNNLIMKINVRKRRDSIVLAVVIASCLIVLIWFAFRWSVIALILILICILTLP